jgi:acetyl-CoA carboxylase/biotin carboxylase 1
VSVTHCVGDHGSHTGGWAQTIVTGRGRLNGIPVAVIAAETRSIERVDPADPANESSTENRVSLAGTVWFPDSSRKTATAIEDANREGLPLIIFANFRGFSGGMSDMAQAILKEGAKIVDGLSGYKHPVVVYLVPNGELRGGAWVVLDPSINPEHMTMFVDNESRGGVLEPEGIVEGQSTWPQVGCPLTCSQVPKAEGPSYDGSTRRRVRRAQEGGV